MSTVLGIAERCGAIEQQPPRLIVAKLLPVRPRSTLANTLASVAHVGYGMAAGALFSLVLDRSRHTAGTGTAYGLVIWLVGYEGWLPAMGILPPSHRDRRGRAATMLAAHLVYGAALAAASRRADDYDRG